MGELSGDPAFQAWVDAEYPAAAEFTPTARRQFLKLMGASFALAGLVGCEKSPFVAALPYVEQPENETIGVPRGYATAVTFDGYAQPVIATTWSGRPTKLDGNPDHPVTLGRSDVFMQAAVLGLYDPDRAQAPARRGEPVAWQDVISAIGLLRGNWSKDQGEGLRVLTGPVSSPTLLRQLDALVKQFPKMGIHLHAAAGETARRKLVSAVYGRPLDLQYVLNECGVVVSFDDDFLGPGPNQVCNARGWAASRRRSSGRPGIRLYAAESVPAATGAVSGTRLIADASRMALVAEALANKLGVSGATTGNLTPAEQRWIEEAAEACGAAKQRALITSGAYGDVDTAIWVARINDALKTAALKFFQPVTGPRGVGSLDDLAADMHAGKIQTLIILDCNAAYTAPAALSFTDALKRVRSSLHLGLQRDETADLCEWQLPLTHALESWSDARAIDGTASIIQPTIVPFYDVRTVHQIMAMLLGEINPAEEGAVRETWQASFGGDFDARWKQALHDGFVAGASLEISATPSGNPTSEKPTSGGLDIIFRPDPTIWDGQFANVGWLQELPKPMTTLTWGNVVTLSPSLAKRMAIANGDHVEVMIGDRSVTGPAWVMPGQAENTVALSLGYGRRRAGRVGDGLGYDAYEVRPADQPWLAKGSLRKTGSHETLAVTQLHHRMEGFDLVREVSAAHPHCRSPRHRRALPAVAVGEERLGYGDQSEFLHRLHGVRFGVHRPKTTSRPSVPMRSIRSAMKCTGCASTAITRAPSTIPDMFFQPVPCMHCEPAPCEVVCPVNATIHTHDGLNAQGLQPLHRHALLLAETVPTRCGASNFFGYQDFDKDSAGPQQAVHNPDVTVRSRGVMEKCTYCVQRISEKTHPAPRSRTGRSR